jgi:Leucine-rich repeat (LRR) protein
LDLREIVSEWHLKTLLVSATGLASLEGVGRMRSLQILQADGNEIVGPIPNELYELSSLRQVHISFNKLNGTISPAIASLVDLQVLHLLGNELSGSIPEQIGQLPNLQELVLAQNRLTGAIPESLQRFDDLTLELGGNSIVSIPGVLCTKSQW